MQQLQESVFNIVKTTNLSPSVFSYLQPCEDSGDKTPLGGILSDTKHGWLALGPKFCVVDLRTGLKVAARTFGETLSNFRTTINSVVELPTPLTDNSHQLLISLECEDIAGMIVVFHINGSQILKCIQTEVVVTQLAVCDGLTDGPFTCFDGVVMAGTKSGEIFVFDLNRASLIQALKDVSEGYEDMLRDEENSAKLSFLPLNAVHQIETQRDLVLENDDHIAVLLNENSLIENQFIFRNPDGTVRMKANRDHVRVTVLQYIPQLGSIAIGFNFGAFQIWNLMNLDLEFTSQVNVECLPVTHIGFQEPCDDPRAFCYLWVVFSLLDQGEEEAFPLAVMYSLTYQGKRMLSDTKCLYQEFLTATIRFQVELSTTDEDNQLLGGRCIACHTFSVNYSLGSEEDSMLNICQLVWECWGVTPSETQHGMLLFDLDQWYNDQMPATYSLQSNAFMSVTSGLPLSGGALTLDARLCAGVAAYCAAASHQRHLQPSSWRCDCICLTTSEAVVLNTIGVQRQIINSMDEIGPTCLLNPKGLYNACFAAGMTPLYVDNIRTDDPAEQRAYLLSVALEARLARLLRRCAHDWATPTHAAAGCTLAFLVDWCWKRALELKENASELTAPLFTSSCLPDRNMTRCLEHCVQQLTQLTNLLDAVLTKCCNLLVPEALSELEERHRGVGTVSLYYRVVQWLLRCGLLPERAARGLPYPAERLPRATATRFVCLHLSALSELEERHRGVGTVSLYYRVVQWLLRCGLLPERAARGLLYPAERLPHATATRFVCLHLSALSELEERHRGVGTVSLYYRVVQWLLRCGLLPERAARGLPYPAERLPHATATRFVCLHLSALSELEERHRGVGTVSLYYRVVQWLLRCGLLPERAARGLLYPAERLPHATATRFVCLHLSALSELEERHRGVGTVSLYYRVVQWLLRCGLLPERAARGLLYPAERLPHATATRFVCLHLSALSELEERHRGVGTVSLYYRVVQWLLRCGLLPERAARGLPYPAERLPHATATRFVCLHLSALSELEERHRGVGTVSLYYRVVQWLLRCGLLPERAARGLPYPAERLPHATATRRLKLQRLLDHGVGDEAAAKQPCPLLYIDQLIEHEFGGERVRELWVRAGSQWHGLYPPPSLRALLRLYLLPDVPEEHKHSLLLYMLVDYSMVYDDVRHEPVIRRLMQFPTMFGLSTTAIKATQAFWHLDHRDFDFALDQLQCVGGGALAAWQHAVALSALLAQKKTQAALQYLHVRKPPPIQNNMNTSNHRVNDHDKLDDWQSCCNLYLARGLVFEALDVIRMCVQNAASVEDKKQVLNFFFKGCRNTGQLAKVLQITMLPFEEEVFIQYLKNCNESQTSEILIMYYLQQARYLEAEQYNNQLKQLKPRHKEFSTSMEVEDIMYREMARDTLVEVVCSSLPAIANTVAHCAMEKDFESYIIAPKPMSVYVQASSPKTGFTYKSSFIQDTIGNASETWFNRPKTRKGLKRALDIEETPFICTPKLNRNRSLLVEQSETSTPPKRPRLDLTGTPKTPRNVSVVKLNDKLAAEMSQLLDMPDVHSPELRIYERAETPHSILKTRSNEGFAGRASPAVADSDDDALETASCHTHYSDSTSKHLRFTIPTPTELESSPLADAGAGETETQRAAPVCERETDVSVESFVTPESRAVSETPPMKTMPAEDSVKARKSYKDSVRARRSLSISANSSLSDDPNTSMESIADIPVTLVNPRYSGQRRRSRDVTPTETEDAEPSERKREVTPRGRRGIRVSGESTPLVNRSRSVTPERQDSPIKPLRTIRMTRSRSRTPELSPRPSPLAAIPEQPRRERESAPHPPSTAPAPAPRPLRNRSRSRTPERTEKIAESPRLEAITESPIKVSESPPPSPTRRSLRSRSRTPEIEVPIEKPSSPRSLRSRAKTPEKIISPIRDIPRSSKKSLTRIVLEANAAKSIKNLEKELEATPEEKVEDKPETVIECTPMKTLKSVPSLMDVTISPIVGKSILQSSNESLLQSAEKESKSTEEALGSQSIPVFTMNETRFGKSVLHSFDSTAATSNEEDNNKEQTSPNVEMKSLPAFTLSETYFEKSVLRSYQSSVGEDTSTEEIVEQSKVEHKSIAKPSPASITLNITSFDKSVLGSYDSNVTESSKHLDKSEDYRAEASTSKAKDVSSLMTSDSDVDTKDEWQAKLECQAAVIQKEKAQIVEIEREIHEIEGEISNEDEDDDEGDEEGDESGEETEEESGDDEEIVAAETDSDTSRSTSQADASEEVISILDTDEEEDDSSVSSNNLQIDDSSSASRDTQTIPTTFENKNIETTSEVNIATIDERTSAIDNAEESGSVDPLNQAQMSLMTDDNSMRESDKSDINLNYSDEKKDDGKTAEGNPQCEEPMEIDREKHETVVIKPQITVEVTMVEEKSTEMDKAVAKPVEETPRAERSVSPKDVVDCVPSTSETATGSGTVLLEEKGVEVQAKGDIEKIEGETKPTETRDEKIESEIKSNKTKVEEPENITESPKAEIKATPTSRTRNRAGSTASNKSNKGSETEPFEMEAPKTPMTRKRSRSIASNKSVEQKSPEREKAEETTPSRRRLRTPSSGEVRKIITRRASKELSEKMDDSQVLEDPLTPKRRSTRARSKNVDDDASIASGSSVRSIRSKASEDPSDVKQSARKGRKSIIPTKPDLSVIPELTNEESASRVDSSEDVINEYSTSRRLTRNQKKVLKSWLEPQPAAVARRPSSLSTSVASRASQASPEDDASSTRSSVAFDVQPIDRISLLNKGDFDGSPDPSEFASNASPESVASDASKQRRLSRTKRAMSETKSTPKAAKTAVARRVSVDIVAGSPAGAGSRGRRASFTRACEALLTPKRAAAAAAAAADLKTESGGSPAPSSEASATPSRRSRRGSAASTASQNKPEASGSASKQSRKTPSLEENKDTKKK